MLKQTLFYLAITLALGLSGCKTPHVDKGSILNPTALAQLQENQSNVRDVHKLLGPPTLVNMLETPRWIYVMDRRKEGEQALNRVEITFDRSGVVRKINRNFEDELHKPVVTEKLSDKPVTWWKRAWSEAKGDIIVHPKGSPEWLKKDLSAQDETVKIHQKLWKRIKNFGTQPFKPSSTAVSEAEASAMEAEKEKEKGLWGWIKNDKTPPPPAELRDPTVSEKLPSWMKE
ncbi:outer membrane protein assembly factor BamE [Magnetococcus sp. PR-3]|uniref:outer membrane protein assembly factor BamE n=1 Tax=Magnetococcus sp. PR-3 TaxID=3120355 RepID=UPI002FCE248A